MNGAMNVVRAVLLGSVALLAVVRADNAVTEAISNATADAAGAAITEAAGGTGMLTSGQSLSQVPKPLTPVPVRAYR